MASSPQCRTGPRDDTKSLMAPYDLKWILLSLSGNIKDLLSVKNLLEGEGDWTCIKEVLGWTVDMKAVTGTLLERNLQEHFILLALPATQR